MSTFSQIYPVNDTLIVNATYAINNHPYTPYLIWVALSGIAIIFFVASFVYKLRNPDGRVSSERLTFSLLAIIFCGLAAWLALAIAIPSSIGETITTLADNSTQLVIIENYTVYSQLEAVLAFVFLSLFSIANFAYTITQKEILKPDEGEFGGPVKAKVRAEGGKE